MTTPPRLLVIGRSGQLARALRLGAARRGIEAVIVGRPELDIGDPEQAARAVAAAGNVDVVINAAAYTDVRKAEAEPEAALRANAYGPGALAAACQARGLALIHVSTDFVFSGEASRPYREQDRPAPLNAYGRSKLAGEEAVLAACARAIVLRTAWVYALGFKNFVTAILAKGREGGELSVVEDQSGSPTSAHDLAEAALDVAARAAAGAGPARGLFHCAGEGSVSRAGFATEILRQAGFSARVRGVASSEMDDGVRRPRYAGLDCARMAREWGVAARPWRDALADELARGAEH